MRILKIVQSNVEPPKENLWVSDNYLKIFTETGWKDIILASYTAETASRVNGDTNNHNAISAETEQRKSAILTEVSDRNTAISESESRSSALVLNETDRAKDVENSISASTLNSINNINTKIDNVNSSLTQSIHSETDRAATAELTLDKKFNENFLLAKATIDNIELSTIKNKGIFTSVSSLETTVPSPNVGDWAGVGTVFPVKLYVCNTAGTWVDSGSTWSGGDINLSDYVTNTTANEIINSLSKKLDSSKINVLSEDEYTALTTKEEGKIYFIYS